jgi:hypothetical protein
MWLIIHSTRRCHWYHFEVINGKELSVAKYLKGHQVPDMYDHDPTA